MGARAGSKLHVAEHGSGRPLLLVGGVGQASPAWEEVASALAGGRRVLAFDHRGTGRSPGPAGGSVDALARDALEVLRERVDEPADVLGLSMGGYVALTLALAEPARVRSLILVATGPGGPAQVRRPAHVDAAFRAARGLPRPERARRTLRHEFAPGWPEAEPERFAAAVRARVDTPDSTLAAHVAACDAFYAAGCPLERIDVPALVVHGAEDAIVPVANGRLLAERLPRAEYVELPGRGHNLAVEAPQELAAIAAGFLARIA